jgi:hypothetical protein
LLFKLLHSLTNFLGNVMYAIDSIFPFATQCHKLLENQ